MSAITFDTLKFAERLQKAGLTRELATKTDGTRLESRIEHLELRLAIKLGTMMVVAVGVVAALVKVL